MSKDKWQEKIQNIEEGFIPYLPKEEGYEKTVLEAVNYSINAGGKRLRPMFLYETYSMFGGTDEKAVRPFMMAMEMIHTYSLVHDDLPAMDDDDLRRGLPTCHVKFGEANAILAGDALQTLAFSILSDADMPEVSDRDRISMISELASASGIAGMCGGQALDLDAEGKHVPLDALERIHRHKTGALIRAAVRLGALSAGDKGRRALPVLDKYAESIGLAFQVQDDILDVVGDTATLGKRQGADQQLGKSTYPALLGLEQARKKARDLIDDARQSLKQLAEQSLDTSALEALADYIIQRNK